MSELWKKMFDKYPEYTAEPWIAHHTLPKSDFAPGAYIREMRILKKGYVAVTHKHNYPHFSILGSGEVLVTCGEQMTRFTSPSIIIIRAGINHSIEALSDNVVWYCLHAIPDELSDAEKIGVQMDQVMIQEGT